VRFRGIIGLNPNSCNSSYPCLYTYAYEYFHKYIYGYKCVYIYIFIYIYVYKKNPSSFSFSLYENSGGLCTHIYTCISIFRCTYMVVYIFMYAHTSLYDCYRFLPHFLSHYMKIQEALWAILFEYLPNHCLCI
jgi:hypothetical protein